METVLFKIISALLAFAMSFIGSEFSYTEELKNEDYTGLKTVYEDYFDIGASVGGWMTVDKETSEFLLKNYSSLTFENAMKLPNIHPTKDKWCFEDADLIADFCRKNNLKLRGHTLLWGNEDNHLLKNDDGSFVTPEVFYKRLHDYMYVIMERYGDVVSTWDVVNEPFNYSSDCAFKDNALYRVCGENFVPEAFKIARQVADELGIDAVLCLNETGVVKNDVKINYITEYVSKWLSQGVPIDAVGIQCHLSAISPMENALRLQKAITKIKNCGIKNIQITELDMGVYSGYEEELYDEIPEWLIQYQAMKYASIFAVLRANRDVISSVTFWGIDDACSYKLGTYANDQPLLFDKNFKPKAAFYAVCDF